MNSLYAHLPTCPGVYLMKNAKGVIIYIGKSNNLKARVRSYFVPNASLNFAKKKMIKLITQIDYIETKSDIEALMLETNLIKNNQPKYNVLMKDGKNLSYITITTDIIPCLIKTRFKTEKGEYFGPYSQYFDVRKYVRFVRKLFRLGNHESFKYDLKDTKHKAQSIKHKEGMIFMPPGERGVGGIAAVDSTTASGGTSLASSIKSDLAGMTGKGVPCMDTYLGLCPGHCTGDPAKIQIYLERLEQAREFLRGKHEVILADLREKMQQAAQRREFEQAQEYKEMIEQIEATGNRQIVRDVIEGDALVVTGLEKYGNVFLSFVEVKNSMTVGVYEYRLENPLAENVEELFGRAVLQYIGEHILLSEKKQTILFTDIALESCTEFAEFIASEKVIVKHPVRGEKVRLLEFAHTNLLNFAYRETMEGFKKATLGKKDMLSLLDTLFGMNNDQGIMTNEKKKEIIFECFDISHSHGEHTVASKSVLVNGKPDPKRYKKYRIKTLKTGVIDDFASMEEILTRRTLAALRGENPWPDLIVIDGGKGQLSHAVQAIQQVVQAEAEAKEEMSVLCPLDKEPVRRRLEGQGGFERARKIKSLKSPPVKGDGTISGSKGVGTSENPLPAASPLQESELTKKATSSESMTLTGGLTKIIPRIISLAKREEEVFLPGQSAPILLEKGSSELMLLQKIRDEAHRFAINYNRASREKGYTKTIFDELPGIGPVARKKILSHISRIEELQTWSLEKAEKAFGKKTAIILQDHGILQG